MIQLTQEQRDFIEHVKHNHKYLGNRGTIETVLHSGQYRPIDTRYLNLIRGHYKTLLNELNGATPDKWYNIQRYGKPTKYLKG